MADAELVDIPHAFGLEDGEADRYLEVLTSLREPVEQLRGGSRATVEGAVRTRLDAAGLSHPPGSLVRLAVSVALKSLYGEDVEANVGRDLDDDARRLTKTAAIEAVRRTRRGKSRDQLRDDLTSELRLRGLEPLLPVEQNLLLASLAAPFLPVRRLDDLGTSAYALAHLGRGAYSLVQKFRHADDGVEDAASEAAGPGGRHRKH